MPEHIEGPAHIGVSHFSCELDFPSESVDLMSALCFLNTCCLNCNALMEFLVLRFVYLTHAAACDESNHSESSRQQLIRLEYHRKRNSRSRLCWGGEPRRGDFVTGRESLVG